MAYIQRATGKISKFTRIFGLWIRTVGTSLDKHGLTDMRFRRICPGLNIVERSTYLLVARIAWASTITKKHGIEVPLYDYTPGFNTQPNRFQFDLKVRSDARREVIEKEFIAMEEETQHLQTC